MMKRLLTASALLVLLSLSVGCTQTCYDCVKVSQIEEVCDYNQDRLDDDLAVYEEQGWECTERE